MQLRLVLGVKLKESNSNLFFRKKFHSFVHLSFSERPLSETEQHLSRHHTQAPRNLHNVGTSVSLCLEPIAEAPQNFLGDWSSYPASVQGRSPPPQKYGFNEAFIKAIFLRWVAQ